jgi:hypothetical protein
MRIAVIGTRGTSGNGNPGQGHALPRSYQRCPIANAVIAEMKRITSIGIIVRIL